MHAHTCPHHLLEPSDWSVQISEAQSRNVASRGQEAGDRRQGREGGRVQESGGRRQAPDSLPTASRAALSKQVVHTNPASKPFFDERV